MEQDVSAESPYHYLGSAILHVHRDGSILKVNDAALELFGDNLVGKRIDELTPSWVRPQHQGHRASYHRAPRVRQMGSPTAQVTAIDRHGAEIRCQVSLVPESDEVTIAIVVPEVP